jgi:hypothetical protein
VLRLWNLSFAGLLAAALSTCALGIVLVFVSDNHDGRKAALIGLGLAGFLCAGIVWIFGASRLWRRDAPPDHWSIGVLRAWRALVFLFIVLSALLLPLAVAASFSDGFAGTALFVLGLIGLGIFGLTQTIAIMCWGERLGEPWRLGSLLSRRRTV